MQDIMGYVGQIKRPKLLIDAARDGAKSYRRERHLARILGVPFPSGNGAALWQIIDLEREFNTKRKRGVADYSVVQHLELMIAMVGEAQLLCASRKTDV